MKTLLIPTDFSVNANHAAAFAYHLAQRIKADITLLNSVIIPTEIPQATLVGWPVQDYDTLLQDSSDELTGLKSLLESEDDEHRDFRPVINCINECGRLTDVVNSVAERNDIDMVIMGTHGNGLMSQFLIGNHSREMIDASIKPLLLVPPEAPFTSIKKIGFATDFTNLKNDFDAIYALLPLAKALGADILLAHVHGEKHQSVDFDKTIGKLLTELSDKANYPHIYYRIVKNEAVVDGLDWLCEHGHIDLLAMIHRPQSFINNLLKGSHSKKMAGRVAIPLLVIPGKE